jgi:uncharacterized protein (UPF0147 family)
MVKALNRAVQMRISKRAQRREQSRSKLRQAREQEIRDILEEFGQDPNVPHTMVDLQYPIDQMERLGISIRED